MPEAKWVRGKALETVLALRALQPGDEIMLRLATQATVPEDHDVEAFNDELFMVLHREGLPVRVHSVDDDALFPININRLDNGNPRYYVHCISYSQIKAWRRPCKSG